MLMNAWDQIAEHAHTKHGFHLAHEWPERNALWQEPITMNFVEKFQLQKVYPKGCRVGLVNKQGQPMLKSWCIATTSIALYEERVV